jgi:hypothetical protein
MSRGNRTVFKAFSIPKIDPDESHCNSRVWVNGEENYCQEASCKARCLTHRPGDKANLIKADALKLNEEILDRRVEELAQDPNSLTELNDEILKLAAIIDNLEDSYGVLAVGRLEQAETIAKLKVIKSTLVEKRLELETKYGRVFNAEWLWEQTVKILDVGIADETVRIAVKDSFLHLLDDLNEAQERKK